MIRRLALSALALAAACATARPLDMREFGARGRDEQRLLAVLKQLYTLQMTYQAQNGRFAADTGELRSVGWEDRDMGSYRPAVTDPGNRLCVAMLPTGASRVAWSMSGDGLLYRGPRCGR